MRRLGTMLMLGGAFLAVTSAAQAACTASADTFVDPLFVDCNNGGGGGSGWSSGGWGGKKKK